MMSYTMPCTSLCSSGGRLMRRTSPCTRIIGGRPDDRCRSDALFLTENASNSVMSIDNSSATSRPAVACGDTLERRLCRQSPTTCKPCAARIARACAAAGRARASPAARRVQDLPAPTRSRSACRRTARFGENYVQEALDKIAALARLRAGSSGTSSARCRATRRALVAEQLRLGAQRRPAEDRRSACREQRPAELPPLKVCIQVNISGEVTQERRRAGGVRGARARGCAAAAPAAARPDGDSRAGASRSERAPHRALRALFDDLRARGSRSIRCRWACRADLEAAIAEGATIVRVGTAIFGARRTRFERG